MDQRRWIPKEVPAFYEKHKRSLPIVGGLIVFATFMAHDYFREDAKDLADSIARAKDAFQVRQEISSQDHTLEDLHEKVNRLYHQLTPSDAIKKTEAVQKAVVFYAGFYDLYAGNHVGNQRLLENIKDLRRRLPSDAVFDYKVEPIGAALKTREQLIGKLHGALFVVTALNEDQILGLIGQLQNQKLPMKLLPSAPARDIDVDLALEWLATDTFFEADRLSTRADKISNFWRIASLWFYAAGFVLGLGGKLVGVNAESAP